jgi:hypothetical protein
MSVNYVIQAVAITISGFPVVDGVSVVPVIEATFRQQMGGGALQVNGGITWSAKILRTHATAMDIVPGNTITMTVSVINKDGAGTVLDSYNAEIPELVCIDPDESLPYSVDGEFVWLNGVDATTYQLSQKGIGHDTVVDTMAHDLVSTIATLAGTTINLVSGSPRNWRVPEFDFPAEEPVGATLLRLCRDGSWLYRIDQSGRVEVFASTASPFASGGTVRYSTGKRHRRNSVKFTRAVLTLRRKYQNEYHLPVDQAETVFSLDLSPGLDPGTIHATDSSGLLKYAAFYDGPSPGGNLCAYIALRFDAPGAPTITSFAPAVIVYTEAKTPTAPATTVNAELVITGRPPSAYDYDPPTEVSTGEAALRDNPLVLESTLWDTTGTMDAVKTDSLAEANAQCDEIDIEEMAVFDPRLWVGDLLTATNVPLARIVETEWSYSEGAVKQSLKAYVTP